ncbi:MAG: TonB-dependent receptor [Sphingomonas bacterium]|uniref:TonB-dependent receptor domain-containing protein n=1 Tax=Sphingomonas bacterium TaxID=1895847 RepID=UPI002634A4C1|nr:TonB-dependent receptor [Sphingomonas bacterium]MDB5705258.1 TonB-dependent receptor [Sphingomonas bacterium]
MKKSIYLTTTVLRSVAVVAMGCAFAPAAFAQSADPAVAAPAADQPGENNDIVVTGSRIARPNLESPVPIVSLTADELSQTGRVSTGDTLNDLPALHNTFSQQNSTRFLGTAGLNLLDLRGLGTQRTLVLVNGRRHVGADILGNAVSPDINTIPTDLIDRVDVVTGGSSAVYGSDAIAGVVNFVLKDHYDGLALHAQSGISEQGDAGAYFGSIVAGRNFAEGRGNIAVNLEYAHQSDFYASDRADLRKPTTFVVVDTDPAGTPNGSDGNPDRLLLNDVRAATLANGGLFSVASPTGACGRDAAGAAFNCTYLFQPDGTLTPQTGTRVGIAPNGNFLGGNGSTGREGTILGILPRLDRYSANMLGHFEISPALVPFFEAKYVRTDTLRSVSGPAFIQGTTLGGDPRERIRFDNPFLSAQARALITAQTLAANPAANVSDSGRFSLRENLTGLGFRNEEAKRETWRFVGGLKGEFNDDWRYELSANYGQFDESTKVLGNLNVQRFFLANDVARNAQGQIVCRSSFDPAARIAIDPSNAISTGNLANDVAQCVPINLFGEGNISEAARKYVVQDTISRGQITQFVASGFVSGDTSGFLNLPGGPVGFAIGAEYRRETARFQEDPLIEAGLTFYNSIPTFTPPAFVVKEAYGELRLPILKDLPFAEELTINAAGRVARYQGSTGTVAAYNVGGDWRPFHDLRLRANYARAVRAPNAVDLYTPQGQNFSPAGFTDPCSARNIGTGSSTRAANCAAAGRPTGYDFVHIQSLEIVSGGNPNLRAETSDSFTYGGVYSPSYVPGLSISVDYYNIKVNDVITAPSAQQIVDACYDAPTLTNPFCGLFQRAGAQGGPAGEVPFEILEGTLQQTLLNYASLKVRGIDVDISYSHDIGIGRLGSHFVWTHSLQNDAFLDPANPAQADRIQGEVGDQKDQFNWNVDLKTGPIQLAYQMRYIGPAVVNFYEDLYSFQGNPPQNADYSLPAKYPQVFYHNVKLGIDANDKFNFYLGVENLTNLKPPLGATGVGAFTGIYEPRGRYFYAGATARF